MSDALNAGCEAYLDAAGWEAFPFQRDVWRHWNEGRSGILHATTGAGKTLAAVLAPIAAESAKAHGSGEHESKLRILWITPLRALASDTAKSIQDIVGFFGLDWRVETRTGDTSSSVRRRQRKQLPDVLITTPESATLLLSHRETERRFDALHTVVVDEWHELMGSKRGTQTELLLARIRRWRSDLRIWGLSATLGNLDIALESLLGSEHSSGLLVGDTGNKAVKIDSLAPREIERFPWFGHIGLTLAEAVAEEIDATESCLVFANTRNQVERWYQALLELRPDWAGRIALHHGSLDRKVRDFVEDGIKSGMFRCVVCTSSLDLGVDFHPVERVFQIGSPKGVARLLQRAGRSGHQPGRTSRVTCVPAHAFELVEVDAARRAADAGYIEPRSPKNLPLDVLSQHLVTIGIGPGFEPESLLAEVRTTRAFAELTDEDWETTLNFAAYGGDTLRAYDEYHRLRQESGRFVAASPAHARRHRMMIGTISSDASVYVKFQNGARVGTVEERFLARLSPGDRFLFSGRVLEFVRMRGLDAVVKRSSGQALTVPKWNGGSLPLSSHLSSSVRSSLARAAAGTYDSPELVAVQPVLELQRTLSDIPDGDELLIEQVETREGFHTFLFPFEGRNVHEGLATLIGWRIAQHRPISFSVTVNDYGLELLTSDPFDISALIAEGLLSEQELEPHILESVNASELAKRQFRSIARVSGLVFEGFPGQAKATRQLTITSSLIFKVLEDHAPDHFLLRQAYREVIETRFELDRMRRFLRRVERSGYQLRRTDRPTPLAFPILADRVRNRISSEKIEDRLRRMVEQLESRPIG